MSCLVFCHFVNGVMDGIEVLLLSANGQVFLSCACAALCFNTHFQILLCGIGNNFSEEFCELGSMLSLFMSSLFIVQADFRISLAESDSGHCQIHTDLRALASEVCLQVLDDFRIYTLSDADNVLICPSGVLIHLVELRSRCAALRTFFRSLWSFIDITTN